MAHYLDFYSSLSFEEALEHWHSALKLVAGDTQMEQMIAAKVADSRYGLASTRRDSAYQSGQVGVCASDYASDYTTRL